MTSSCYLWRRAWGWCAVSRSLTRVLLQVNNSKVIVDTFGDILLWSVPWKSYTISSLPSECLDLGKCLYYEDVQNVIYVCRNIHLTNIAKIKYHRRVIYNMHISSLKWPPDYFISKYLPIIYYPLVSSNMYTDHFSFSVTIKQTLLFLICRFHYLSVSFNTRNYYPSVTF